MKIKHQIMQDIIIKVIGDIYPYGDTAIDMDRLENLEEFGRLTEWMVGELAFIAARCEDRTEHSIKEVGAKARFYCDIISECIKAEDGKIK